MGSVVISIDAELGWGHHDLPDPPVERVEYARTGWVTLVDLHETYGLPATWAVVGHLLLESCDGVHADHPTPAGWFARERGEWADRPDLRFGEGLIERVVESDVGHELGCHTFSHVRFGDPATTSEMARAELAASEAALRARADDFGLERFDSFVFPRNEVGHRNRLAEAGYRCYRGRVPGPRPTTRWERTGRKLGAVLRRSPPPLVTPAIDEYGLVNVPASLYLFGFERVPRAVVSAVAGDPVVERAKRGIDRAAREEGVCHLWLHPNNLVGPRERDRLEAVYAYLRDRVEAGDVTVETMGDVAERTLEAASDASDASGDDARVETGTVH